MPPSRASNMSSYPNQGPSRRLGWPMKPNPGSARAATGAPVMRPILACLSAASAWTVASTMVTRAWNAGLVGASLPMICGPLLDRPPDIDEAVSLRVTSRPSPAFSPISHQKLELAWSPDGSQLACTSGYGVFVVDTTNPANLARWIWRPRQLNTRPMHDLAWLSQK